MEHEFERQLRTLAIERRPEACLGCGFEHGCSVHGCAVIHAAAERLAAYEETRLEPEDMKKAFNEDATLKLTGQALGMSPDRLRELAQAEKTGQLAEFPFIAMVEQSLRDGTMKPMSDQKHNGRYAVVYKSERWTFPLIDICGTPYNTEQAVERMREISREAAEAALDAMGGENNA